ncbi:MAG: hypothetical protein AMS21_06060 [Gemmatimonas sp. SG8_38_2]|nr:MAG: hypothetical protein AMS21_06060 [Gemmatimonas sp. SG8_38_2]
MTQTSSSLAWGDLMVNHTGGILDRYQYMGARALVLLHEEELRRFVETWKTAKDAGIRITGCEDPNYESLEKLVAHVLWWARDYMTWVCDRLGLPDPEIRMVPRTDVIEVELDAYLEHLLDRWRSPLCDIPEEPFFGPQHTTRWGTELPIEALLEHAVVHPMRHRLQLLELVEQANHKE